MSPAETTPDTSPLTPRQLEVIEGNWHELQPRLDKLAERFYAGLFEIAPEVKPLFADTDMADQRKKLTDLLTVAIMGLRQFAFLVAAISELGKRHIAYGVKDSHYSAVRAALLGAVSVELGESFDAEARTAWELTYDALAEIMTAGTAE